MIHSVLLVEDDRDIRENMIEFLELEGYEVEAASNGLEALDRLKARTELPSVILLDLMMPVMDGIAFRREQRKDPRIAEVPVVLMTANGRAESHADQIAARALVKKPVDIDALADLLKSI